MKEGAPSRADPPVVVMDGGRQASGTDPVAGQVDQLAQPVLRTDQQKINNHKDAKTGHELCAVDRSVPALRQKSNQNRSDDEPREADDGQSDPAGRRQSSSSC